MTNHAKERALERYGIELDVDGIIETIRGNKAKMLQRVTNTKAIYQLEHQQKQLLVLYNRAHRAVITVLPPGHFKSKFEALLEIQRQDELYKSNSKAMDDFNKNKLSPTQIVSVGRPDLVPTFPQKNNEVKIIALSEEEYKKYFPPGVSGYFVRVAEENFRTRFVVWVARVLDVPITLEKITYTHQ